MIAAFFDPRLFNIVIMTLYIAASIRWAISGHWADCGYWLSAFAINACVTWGYQR